MCISVFLSRIHFGGSAAFSCDTNFSGHAAFGGKAAFRDNGPYANVCILLSLASKYFCPSAVFVGSLPSCTNFGGQFCPSAVFVRVQSLLAPSPRAPMSEADWERRLRKRHAAVAHLKSTSDYRICEREDLLVNPPFEPGDRTVSKRKWEASIQLWRRALQQAADALATMPPSWISL